MAAVRAASVRVELAPAVVRDHDRVRSGINDRPRVLDGLDPLDHDRAVPCIPHPGEVRNGDRRVEDPVDEVGDRARVSEKAAN